MSQNLRFVLFVLLSVAILAAWSHFFGPKPPPPGEAQKSPAPAQTAPTVPAPSGTTPAPGGDGVVPAPPVAEELPVQNIPVSTGLWKAVFSTKGAALASFELTGEKQQRHQGSGETGVNLVHVAEGQPLPLSAEVPVVGAGSTTVVGPEAVYRVASSGPNELVFERPVPGGVVRKSYRWTEGSYALGLEVAVPGEPAKAPMKLLYPAFEEKPEEGGFLSSGELHEAVCYLDGARSMEARGYQAHEDVPVAPEKTAAFVGQDEKYFLAAMAPRMAAPEARCALGSDGPTKMTATLTVPMAAGAGGAGAAFDLFLGPKASDQLEAFGHGAEVAIYNGSIAKAGKLLMPILKFFQGLTANWGLAIILLTVLVKLLTLPLANRQMESMEKMKLLGPKMEEIKKRYDGDPQRQNAETMRLYQEHGVSPIGCAVPMLVQMPIWWALYSTLQNSYELYNEPFFGWIHDLTVKDPFFVLPVLMTGSMVVTQLLTPQQTQQAPEMKAMTYAMPLMFGFMMAAYPAGLVLYIFTNNLLSIAHSWWYRRKVAAAKPA
jgi:YidC/Oxa1 family membrane protein insertase